MLIRNNPHDEHIFLNGVELKTSKKEKLLEVLINKKLSFDPSGKKASQKIGALARLSNHLTNA